MGAIEKEIVAAEALVLIEKGASEREALRKISEKYNIQDPRIRGAIHSIVFETIRYLNVIDFLIRKSLQKGNLNKLYPLLRNLLRVSVYILKFTKTPPQKITKIIVELSKTQYSESISKFVNAILRKVEILDLQNFIKDAKEVEKLSLIYYHPTWFIEYLIKLIGISDATDFMKTSVEEKYIYIRINTIKTNLDEVIETLEQERYEYLVDQDLSDVIRITNWQVPIVHSSLFKEGLIYIQDKASALVSHVVNPQSDQTILDLCAAPGGKSLHIAQLMQNTGRVISLDKSYRRLLELTRKLKQYEIRNIYPLTAYGEKSCKFINIKADKILVDPPCSGTGTFISRPYSKWKLQLKIIGKMAEIQWNLLKAAALLLKPQGEIIYSTCSITLEENEQLITQFLKEFPDFQLIPAKPFIGTPGFLGLKKAQRLWPHLHQTEGFFIVKLIRN
ncbi:MAG: 16S rRNA (cytosine(967)-C(5))-methyltransferase RsmB [Candidatus Helarchaeota archaeon]